MVEEPNCVWVLGTPGYEWDEIKEIHASNPGTHMSNRLGIRGETLIVEITNHSQGRTAGLNKNDWLFPRFSWVSLFLSLEVTYTLARTAVSRRSRGQGISFERGSGC